MAIPHSKPRHKKSAQQTQHHPVVRGNHHAHRNGTHHQHPLIMRAEDNINNSQRQSVRSHHHQHRKQGNPKESKRQAKLYNARLANQTNNQTDGEPATQNPANTIGNSSSHPATSCSHQLPEKLGISLPIRPRNKRADARHRRRALGGTSPQSGGRSPPASPHTPGTHDKLMFTTRPSPRGDAIHHHPQAALLPIKCKQSLSSPRRFPCWIN